MDFKWDQFVVLFILDADLESKLSDFESHFSNFFLVAQLNLIE